MKKKTIALCGLAAVAGLSLASCGTDTTGLDIYINYQGASGITYQGASAFTNTIEEKTYTTGVLLPTWQAFSDNLNIKFRDASGYTTDADNDTYNLVQSKGYVSDTDAKQKIDLFYNTTANINKMGNAGDAVNLVDHLDEMPNFKAFLEANPTIRKTLEQSGAIYYTPYFDGYNDIERMFVMDTQIAEKVIDTTDLNQFDAGTTNGGSNPSKNVVQSGSYQPYMGDNNYRADAIGTDNKVEVSVVGTDGKATKAKLNVVENIIKQQNALLANGCTGKQLAEQFQKYLKDVYGDLVGEGKLYSKYSEVFTSISAIYTPDDLIALMRVVKANPQLITGDGTKEIETFFPRGQANNRVDNIADMLQLWGIQGMVSEKEMLYFSADGKLRDAATTQATYDGLEYLKAIYKEGLILDKFWDKPASTSGTAYLDKYFKKTTNDAEYGFMMYDYAAATTASNDMVDGVGTDPTSRKINYSSKGIMPILPPLAYWNTGVNQDSTLKATLVRHADENRTLKSNSWCIPTTSDNIADAIKLMDYMFSEEGARIQDFGPEQYWEDDLKVIAGEESPVLNEKTRQMLAESGKDFWTFMRENIGSTHGIGCERSKALDVQATNSYGQIGLNNLKTAIAVGVVNSSLVDKVIGTNTWDTSVPTAGYPSISADNQAKYAGLTAFWSSDKCSDKPAGWVMWISQDCDDATVLGTDANKASYTMATVKEQMSIKNEIYLYQYAKSIGDSAIPSELQPTN